jgi:hypothetical protein
VLHSRLAELVTKGTVQSVDRPLRPAAEPRPSRAFCSGARLGMKVSDEFTVPLCSVHQRSCSPHRHERSW